MIFGFNASEVFRIAIEIEDNGKTFYENALKIIKDPEIQELFKDLALQEGEHKRRFEQLLASLPSTVSGATIHDPEDEMADYIKMMADQHVFRTGHTVKERLEKLRDSADALRLAIDFEKDSVLFFLTLQEATDEKKGRELIGALVKEEQEHLRRLSVRLNKITQG